MKLIELVLGPYRARGESPWGAFAAVAAALGVVVFAIAASFGIVLIAMLVAPDWASGVFACMANSGQAMNSFCGGWLLALSGLWGVFIAAGFYGLAHLKAGSPRQVLLLAAPGLSWWQYVAVLVAMLIVLYVVQFILATLSGASPADLKRGLDELKQLANAGTRWHWVLLFIVVAVIAPISEEFAFRGFLMTSLAKTRLGFWGAAVATSAAWTILHYAYVWQLLAALFVFGMMLSYIVWRTGSVWTGVFVHGINNLISALLLAVPQAGP